MNSGLIRQHNSKIVILGQIIDILVIGLTLWAVLDMLYIPWDALYTWWLLIATFSFLIFAEFNDLYKESRGVSFSVGGRQILVSWFSTLCMLVIVNQFNQMVTPINQQAFIYWCIAVPIELVSWHSIIYWIIGLIRKMGRNSRTVAIIGDTRLGHELEGIFRKEEGMGLNFVGFYDDRERSREQEDSPLPAGNVAQLIKKTKAGDVDIVYITLALKAENRIKAILADFSDTTASVYYVPEIYLYLIC